MSGGVKLGSRVRVTGRCSLHVGTVGVVVWLSSSEARACVMRRAFATVPLNCVEVGTFAKRRAARAEVAS